MRGEDKQEKDSFLIVSANELRRFREVTEGVWDLDAGFLPTFEEFISKFLILPNENVLTVGARTLRVYNSQTDLENEICRINLSELSGGLDYINEFINLSVKEGEQ